MCQRMRPGYQEVVEAGLRAKHVGAAMVPLHSDALVQQLRGGLAGLGAAPAPDMLLLASVTCITEAGSLKLATQRLLEGRRSVIA